MLCSIPVYFKRFLWGEGHLANLADIILFFSFIATKWIFHELFRVSVASYKGSTLTFLFENSVSSHFLVLYPSTQYRNVLQFRHPPDHESFVRQRSSACFLRWEFLPTRLFVDWCSAFGIKPDRRQCNAVHLYSISLPLGWLSNLSSCPWTRQYSNSNFLDAVPLGPLNSRPEVGFTLVFDIDKLSSNHDPLLTDEFLTAP